MALSPRTVVSYSAEICERSCEDKGAQAAGDHGALCSGQFLRAELPAKARKLLVDMAQSAAVLDCRQLQRDDQFCEGALR